MQPGKLFVPLVLVWALCGGQVGRAQSKRPMTLVDMLALPEVS